ncbi:hypothetical protein H5T87_08160 [bacterium]|nr:hypothetical protein [bacterium]
MLKRFVLYILFLIAWMGFSAYMPDPLGPVTMEQAKQAIVNWAGRQNLEINFEGHNPHPGCYWYEFQCYKFSVYDPNPDGKYSGYISVDSFSGAVVEIERPYCMNLKPDEEITSMISPMQAITIAKEAAKSYFPNVPIESFEMAIDPDIINNGAAWSEHRRRIFVYFENAIYTPSGEKVWIDVQGVTVVLNSETGEWWAISCAYEPIEISPIPNISQEEAIQSAISFLYALGAEYVELEDVEEVWSLAREEGGGPQKVVKGIELHQYPGVYGTYEGCGAWIKVDGHTGEVLRWTFSWGGFYPEKKKFLTLLFNGKEYKWKQKPIVKSEGIYISSDDVKMMGFKVAKSGKNYLISYKKGKATIGGKDVIQVKGKLFIKSSALEKLKGIKVKHLKEFNILNIWVMNEKSYQQGKKEREKMKTEEW